MSTDSLIEAIHTYGPGWAERSARAEADGRLADETADELRSLGAHRVLQPASFGGGQSSIEAHMEVMAAIAEHCGAAAWCTSVWSAHNWMVAQFPAEGQAEVWSDPSVLISASIVPKTPLAVDGDQVLIEGRFPFASGCDHSPWLGIGGMLPGDEPTPVICLVPAAEVEIDHASWAVSGLAGTGSKDLVIESPIAVPPARVLAVPLADQGRAPGQLGPDRALYRTPFRATASIVLAATALGLAKAATRRFEDRLDGHVLMASRSSQRADPAAGLRLAESSAETNAAELVLLSAARRLDDLDAAGRPDPVAVASVVRDTAYGVRLCANAVDRLYEASGGSALRTSEPMQRYWRDVNAARAHAVLTWDGAASAYARAVLR